MGVTSVTDIQNSALIKLGVERITSEDDNSLRARLVKEQYPKRRDNLLRAHPWKFATRRMSLSIISPTPTDLYDFTYAFQLPSDSLRVLETSLQELTPWQIEGRYLYCDESELSIKYISKVTDVSKFDDNFCEVLAWDLAADVCFALTNSTARETLIRSELKLALAEARSFNAQQGSVQRVYADEWLDGRYY